MVKKQNIILKSFISNFLYFKNLTLKKILKFNVKLLKMGF